MAEFISNWLIDQGFRAMAAGFLARCALIALVIALSTISYFVIKRIFLSAAKLVIARTKTTWDDAFLERKVLDRLAHLAPGLVIYLMAPLALSGHLQWIAFVQETVLVYMIVMGVLMVDSILDIFHDIYSTFEVSREFPIKGFVQVLKIVLYFLGVIFIVSILINRTPLYLLSGLGALTAITMLIFRDAILGFVAGIQLSANKMVSQGDWIEMPKYGADGDVLEVALTTVKVQNFDKTITTIPTYALISDSFKNWRGMQESGGRRIKRAIHIDIHTIRFCTEEMLERFSRIQYIADYIREKKKEIAEHNIARRVDTSSPVNVRQLTNIGTFRAYVTAYLRDHPMVNQDMTLLIRQLPPGEYGLPIEIYVFCKDIVWANYEAVQADLFDHILAVVPEFDLKVFQNPTGADFRTLKR